MTIPPGKCFGLYSRLGSKYACSAQLLRTRLQAFLLLAVVTWIPMIHAQSDPTTINNKAMTGYQGWHRCAGDGANQGWYHWSNDSTTPILTNLHPDLWPDTTEYSVLYQLPYWTDVNLNSVYTYSDVDLSTTLLHFQWMQQANIDGAWLQRFCMDLPGAIPYWIHDADYGPLTQVMNNVIQASSSTGRVWAVNYDMIGGTGYWTSSQLVNIIETDWKHLVDTGVTSGPRYLHNGGKPVVNIWGFFTDSGHVLNPADAQTLVNFFHTTGTYQAYVAAGTLGWWASYPQNLGGTGWQVVSGTSWLPVIESCDAVCPAECNNSVPDSYGVMHARTDIWQTDISVCQQHNLNWIPCLYAGFSWNHEAALWNNGSYLPFSGTGSSTLPRRGGQFLWEQIQVLKNLGVTQAYFTMFDEVDEGTAIYKCTNTPPCYFNNGTTGGVAQWVTYDGLPSGWYLQEINAGVQQLHGATATAQIPYAPIPSGLYSLSMAFNASLSLDALNSGTANGTAVTINTSSGAPNQLWLIMYKGNGLYDIHPSYNTNLSLTLLNGGTSWGTQVVLQQDQGANSQLWSLANSAGQYALVPACSTLSGSTAIIDPGASTTPGTQLVLWQNFGTNGGQLWNVTPIEPIAPGTYTMQPAFAVSNTYAVDAYGTSSNWGTKVDLNSWNNNASNQKWVFNYAGFGLYDIHPSYAQSLSMAVSGGGPSGTGVILWGDCNDTPYRWSAIPGANGVQFEPQNAPGCVLTDSGSSTQTGTSNQLIILTNNGAKNEQWVMTASLPLTSGSYRIQSYGNQNFSIDAYGGGTGNGTIVEIWTNSGGSSHQDWVFTYKGNGYYKISPAYSSAISMTVTGAGSAYGTKIILQTDQGLTSQLWAVVPNGNGSYTLMPKCSIGNVLNIDGGNYTNGYQLDIWQNCYCGNQQWLITPFQ